MAIYIYIYSGFVPFKEVIFHSYVELPGVMSWNAFIFWLSLILDGYTMLHSHHPWLKRSPPWTQTKVETWTTEPPLNPRFFFLVMKRSRGQTWPPWGGTPCLPHKTWDAPRLATPGWAWKLVLFFHGIHWVSLTLHLLSQGFQWIMYVNFQENTILLLDP